MDIHLVCCKCHKHFRFSFGEQLYFYARGFDAPRHCKRCRSHRYRFPA
ncbi:MAG: zinc-ribbon domain containing protein [Oscillospiraceae bacterium]|nr:zinc-ribbon domain containing protein [Oscillospiraceae bacterium]